MEQISTLNAFKRHARPILAGVVVGMTLIWAQNAFATPAQPTDNTQHLMDKERHTCARAIAAQERREAIPTGLLRAISLAESGRWNATDGEILAWPWTVTTGGKGYFLPNRVDAVAFVKSLRADGVENIDVGCMQINLKYHPDAFASISEAFEPTANAAYAAAFLRERFAATNSWIEAAGQYHSTTPELNATYRAKITKLWQGAKRSAPVQTASAAITLPRPDTALTQRFNAAFQARRTGGGGLSASGQVIANRVNALKPAAHIARLQDGGATAQADGFAQKRQSQLAAWRQRQGLAPLGFAPKPQASPPTRLVPGPAVAAPGSLDAVLQDVAQDRTPPSTPR